MLNEDDLETLSAVRDPHRKKKLRKLLTNRNEEKLKIFTLEKHINILEKQIKEG